MESCQTLQFSLIISVFFIPITGAGRNREKNGVTNSSFLQYERTYFWSIVYIKMITTMHLIATWDARQRN